MSYIYKITNNINGKVYIGKTNNTIKERFNEHIIDSKKSSKEKRPLYRAMNKYGIENFIVEKVEECDYSIVNEREKFWIEYYGSFKDGYNATLGGDGKSYLDYELIYNTYNKTKSLVKTAKICNCNEDSVRMIIKLKGISSLQIQENNRANRSKNVAMIDKITGEVIRVFTGTWEAGRFLGKGQQHIQEVCQGKRKSAYGYFWEYLDIL